jgi:hypothetical protein
VSRSRWYVRNFRLGSEHLTFFVGGGVYGRWVSNSYISEVEQLITDVLKDDDSPVATRVSPDDGSAQSRLDPCHLKALDSASLLKVLRGAAVRIARLQALQQRVVAELSEQHQEPEEVAVKVSSVLPLSLSRARKMVAVARALSNRLPMTLTLMETGVLDGSGAAKVSGATDWLSDDDARAVDALLHDRLPGKDADQAQKAASYAARRIDPAGAARRTREAVDARRVTVTCHRTGTSSLVLGNGSADEVNAIYDRLDRMARELNAEGEGRSLDQLRADVAFGLLGGADGGDPAEVKESSLSASVSTRTRPAPKVSPTTNRRSSRRHRRGRQGKTRQSRTRSCSG